MSLSAEEQEIRARDVADRDVDFLLGLLDASRAQAEEAAKLNDTFLAVLPGVLYRLIKREHQRWLDGKPFSARDEYEKAFYVALEETFAEAGGSIETPRQFIAERDEARAQAETLAEWLDCAKQGFHDAAKLGNSRWRITRYCQKLEKDCEALLAAYRKGLGREGLR